MVPSALLFLQLHDSTSFYLRLALRDDTAQLQRGMTGRRTVNFKRAQVECPRIGRHYCANAATTSRTLVVARYSAW